MSKEQNPYEPPKTKDKPTNSALTTVRILAVVLLVVSSLALLFLFVCTAIVLGH